MQRTYELMFIVRPDMPEEDQDKLIANLEGQVSNAGGTVKSVERMGKRRLAYVVRKFQDGIYMLMTLEGEGAHGEGSGAPPARHRASDQVHYRARGRRAEAPGQGQGAARRQGSRQGNSRRSGRSGSGRNCGSSRDSRTRSTSGGISTSDCVGFRAVVGLSSVARMPRQF